MATNPLTSGADTPIPTIERVGVIGAGQMGSGIAQVMAQAGYDVRMTDVDEEAAQKGLAKIQKNLERAVQRGKLDESAMKAALERISTGVDYDIFDDCEFVIEAATERERRAVVREGIKTLSEHYRTALTLYHLEEMSVSQSSDIMTNPEGTVKSHLYRGRKKLKDWLLDHYSQEELTL